MSHIRRKLSTEPFFVDFMTPWYHRKLSDYSPKPPDYNLEVSDYNLEASDYSPKLLLKNMA
jgi:hypothetical protein